MKQGFERQIEREREMLKSRAPIYVEAVWDFSRVKRATDGAVAPSTCVGVAESASVTKPAARQSALVARLDQAWRLAQSE